MALQIINGSTVGAGIRVDLGEGLDDLFVGENGFIGSTNTLGIQALGSGHHVTIYGTVVGLLEAMRVGNTSSIDNSQDVLVAEGAHIYSEDSSGIAIYSYASTVTHLGLSEGGYAGIYMTGSNGASQSLLINHGDAHGEDFGVVRNGTEDFRMVNTGTVTSESSTAYGGSGSSGDQTIVNRGLFDGDVILGAGNDLFSTSGKGQTTGTVFGGSGMDKLFGGKKQDSFDGGIGNDRIKGKGGNDSLNGGIGVDKLFGGGGRDNFVFANTATSEGKTTVMDFKNGTDRLDFRVYDDAFGLSFSDIKQASKNKSGDLKINMAKLGGDGTVIVKDFTKAQLDQSDVLL